MIEVEAPDGSVVEFPDGTPSTTMTSAMQKKWPKASVSTTGSNGVPLPSGSMPRATVPQTTDEGLGLWRGLAIPRDNANVAIEGIAKGIGLPVERMNKFMGYTNAPEQRAQDIQYIKDQRAQGHAPGGLGEMVGSTVASAPVLAATRNPFIGGAAMGALSSEAPDKAGVLADAGAGALLGKVGELGTRAVGAAVAPQLSGPVNRLLDKGIRLTPGQMLGGNVRKVEDAATSGFTPFVASAQHRSLDDANRALVNEGLASINEKLPDNVATGHDAINYFQQRMDKAYDDARSGLTVKKDPQWDAATMNLRLAAASMPQKYANKFAVQLSRVRHEFGASGSFDGQTMKDLEEKLGKEAKDWGGKNASGPEDREYADRVLDLQQALRDVAGRSDPQFAAKLQQANEGYTHLTRLEAAAANTKDGLVTPGQYRNAIVQGDNSIRHRDAAAGNAFNQETASDMEQVLPRQLPDSGTIARGVVNGLTGAAIFGGADHLIPHINPLAAGAGAALLAPYTRTGGAVLRTIVRPRSPGVNTARRVVRGALTAASPIVGDVNAAERVRGRDDNLAGVQ